MDHTEIWESLVVDRGGTIVYLILDGLGGLQKEGKTELQNALTPNLDQLAEKSVCGLLDIVGPGITPGSGAGHLALFGYDPIKYDIGRGILAALGIDFDLQTGDIAARFNFATVNEKEEVTDRRAGRISTEKNKELCEKIRKNLNLEGVECFVETVSEHRGLLVLRGADLGGNIQNTDPETTGLQPNSPAALDEKSKKTSKLVEQFIQHTQKVLQDEKPANMILLRGFDMFHSIPSLEERFRLKGICYADYPMYKGVSRLLGMEIAPSQGSIEERFKAIKLTDKHNFYFIHVKQTDKAGEDGDFDRKVKVIEEIDRYLPEILHLNPDVLVITGDHSTPAVMGQHSWHPVPVLISAKYAQIDPVKEFNEIACISGGLGRMNATHLMGLALGHAGRMKKYGG